MIFVWKASIYIATRKSGKRKGPMLMPYAHVPVIYFWSCRSPWKVLQPEEEGSIGMLRWYHHDWNDWNKQHHPWPPAPRSAGRIRTDRPKAQRSPCLSEAWWWRGRHVIDVWLLLMFEIVEFYQRRHRSGFFTFVPKYPFKMPITCYKQRC